MVFNGEGTFYSKDGLKYVGEFNNDYLNGKGKLINQEKGKIIYEGDFKLSNMDGNGKFYFDNNYYYIGQFKDNKMEGDGTVYNEKGEIEYEGKFKNDQPQDSIILQKLFSIFKLK